MEGDRPTESVTRGEPETFRAIIEKYEGQPDQCTIYPETADEIEQMATWVTAHEPAFVALEQMR